MNVIIPDWPVPEHVRALITQKQPISGKENHYATVDATLSSLNLPSNPILPKQTHSDIALNLANMNPDMKGDAVYTDRANAVCAILTADCLPILLSDRAGKQVAAIHAGWRGMAKGIIEATVSALPVPRQQLYAWLGPAISQAHFEVGKDVYNAFTLPNSSASSCFEQTGDEKWHADLYGLARLRLQNLGVTAVFGGNYCTYRDKELFYSYRRDNGNTGRMISLIWMIK